jgi:hypothetical protein
MEGIGSRGSGAAARLAEDRGGFFHVAAFVVGHCGELGTNLGDEVLEGVDLVDEV